MESRFGRVRVRVENDDTQWTNPHAASSAPQDVDVRQLLEISLADFSIRDEMSSRTAGDMSASEGHETVLLQFETTTTDRFTAEPERAGFTLGPVWSDHEPETPTTYARVRYAPSTTLQLRGPAAQCMLDGKAVRESVSVGWHSVDCTAKDRAPWHARILAFGEPISVLPDPRPLEAGKVQLIQLPGGTTRMGCPARDGPCEKKRGAGHDATFQPFWMARTETTVRDYQRCVQEGKCADTSSAKDAGCNRGPEKSDHPVNCVTLEQANRFCSWAGARLPSLDEWRYAARSGQPALSGGLAEDKRVNIHQNHAGTIPVGSLPLPNNAFDLQDLGGNVSEWTSSLRQGKPVVAGGSFASRKEAGSWGHFRASQPDSSAGEVGFRCAR